MTKNAPAKIRRGGRPSREEAGQIEDKILDAAATLFFSEGYGLASIEEIAKRAQISKRTFYSRYENKGAVFRAVIHRIIEHVRPASAATGELFEGKSAEIVLSRIAPLIVGASLAPETLSLHRIIVAEAMRFPELALIISQQTARQDAIKHIAAVLKSDPKTRKSIAANAEFAAEQFLFMLTVVPQRHAMGLGKPMTSQEIEQWIKGTIDLFLNGSMQN